MFDFSRPERDFILTVLILGLLCTGLSYSRKRFFSPPIKRINISEPRILININTANAQGLEYLPGIGPVLAQEIVTYRKRAGGFNNVEELKNLKGIGDKKFEKIKDLITIGE